LHVRFSQILPSSSIISAANTDLHMGQRLFVFLMNIDVPLCYRPGTKQGNFNVIIFYLLQVLECNIISVESLIISLLSAVWIMLPGYVPNPIAALCGGGIPIDFGRNLHDGRRVLGEGKTYRGFFIGILAGVVVGVLQMYLAKQFFWTILPIHTSISVVVLAVGALFGDMCKSFFKRRLGKKRGERWPIADQYDLVLGAFLLMFLIDPQWLFSYVTVPVILIILIITPILHRLVNIIGYYSGIKEVPW